MCPENRTWSVFGFIGFRVLRCKSMRFFCHHIDDAWRRDNLNILTKGHDPSKEGTAERHIDVCSEMILISRNDEDRMADSS